MLQIKNLRKSFGELEVLQGVDLEAKKGEVVALIGPSGTGKSTLLRCINFIEHPECGTIRIGDIEVNAESASAREIQQLRKKTAMVFQNYCLFKNKTVLENIMIPMTLVQKKNKKQAEEEALQLLQSVGLTEKKDAFPSRLSGGQQQRIGIARALAVHPEVILFDEPTSSLDPELVGEVLELMKALAENHQCTMLIVTHEMRFALDIADKIVFMDGGNVLEEGTAEEIMFYAKNERTRKFLETIRR